ncbi:hypothetical protein PO098_16840, partial [Bacteroides stercoris]
KPGLEKVWALRIKKGCVSVLTQPLSCFWAIIPNREVKFICLPCLVLLAFLFFVLLAFLGSADF